MSDCDSDQISKKTTVAAVVRTIDKSHIRVGNDIYVKQNGSRGATTLAKDNVEVKKDTIILNFLGKSKISHLIKFKDNLVAKFLKLARKKHFDYVFTYTNSFGNISRVTPEDINDYLKNATNNVITIKDFRTWTANVIFLDQVMQLYRQNPNKFLKKHLTVGVKAAAEALGNTPAICKKSYIHPSFFKAFDNGHLSEWIDSLESKEFKSKAGLHLAEQKLIELLDTVLEYS